MENIARFAKPLNRIALGLVMLVPGLIKLFVMGPEAFAGMLSGLGFPMPLFLAWLVTIAEIASGIAILINWRIKQVIWVPIAILLFALFSALWPKNPGGIPIFLVQLAVVTNYLLMGATCDACKISTESKKR